jgi:hypothetical protein
MIHTPAHSANNAAAGAVSAETNSFKLFNDCITTLIGNIYVWRRMYVYICITIIDTMYHNNRHNYTD